MAPEVLHRVLFSHPTTHTKPPISVSHTSHLKTRPALLGGYTRHRVRGCDYPAILPDSSSEEASVRGVIVTGLTDGDVWRLDLFEGGEYRREKVKVWCGGLSDDGGGVGAKFGEGEGEEEMVEAETYVWKERGGKGLEAREWDFEEFRREKMRRWIGRGRDGEGEYKEVDEAVARASEDPTGGRGLDGDMDGRLNGGHEKASGKEVLESAV